MPNEKLAGTGGCEDGLAIAGEFVNKLGTTPLLGKPTFAFSLDIPAFPKILGTPLLLCVVTSAAGLLDGVTLLKKLGIAPLAAGGLASSTDLFDVTRFPKKFGTLEPVATGGVTEIDLLKAGEFAKKFGTDAGLEISPIL